MPVTRMASYIYKYARVCQKPGRGWQRDDTKGLIVLAGDSRGLHGRWPGNGYFYRWNTHVQARTHFPVATRESESWGGTCVYVSLTYYFVRNLYLFKGGKYRVVYERWMHRGCSIVSSEFWKTKRFYLVLLSCVFQQRESRRAVAGKKRGGKAVCSPHPFVQPPITRRDTSPLVKAREMRLFRYFSCQRLADVYFE